MAGDYKRSKYLAEQEVLTLARAGLPVVIVNPSAPVGERYILGNRNLMLREIFELLSRLTGVPAPTIKLPRLAILPLAYANKWIADYVTHKPPRIPLEGVKMAKYRMHYDCGKAIRELGLPQPPIEIALEKAVRWFKAHGYA